MDVPKESSCQSVEAPGLQEEVQGVKPTVTTVTGGEGDEAQKKIKCEDEQGAAGEGPCPGAGMGEGADAGIGAGASSGSGSLAAMKDDGGTEEKPGQPEWEEPEEELSQGEAEGSQPPDMDHITLCRTVSELRLHEVERIFQRTQYPEMLAREDPPVPLSATESECQESEKQ
ncbi:short stature homeobox protein 2-like [Dipodomys merriami]|uniref:short stature homeobox protein 2-like n=1 Tax=Dipodomys merriami TaxID=94247 RepID=UPI00385575BC